LEITLLSSALVAHLQIENALKMAVTLALTASPGCEILTEVKHF
jgi:hypothetical protein